MRTGPGVPTAIDHQNHLSPDGRLTARQIVYSYLVFTSLLGVLSVALSASLASMAQGAWLILSMAVPYLWFYRDVAERRFARTYPWSTGIILFSVIAVPLYLFKSRAPGQRLMAMVKAGVAFALSMLLPVVSAAIYTALFSVN